jgi:ureidoacrylate peracid hydrolase
MLKRSRSATTVLPADFPQDFLDNIMKRRGRLHVFDRIEPRRTALLVIDMQNAWLRPGAAWEQPAARAIVPNVNRLARATRAAGGLVVWIQATHAREGKNYWATFFDNFTRENRLEGSLALTEGHPDHDLYYKLDLASHDVIVKKLRFSPFIHGSSDIEQTLRSRGIDTVIVCGTRTNVCCETTARDAMMLDFKVFMVSDATAAASEREHIAGLMTVFKVFGDVRPTGEIIGLLEAGTPK